MAGEKFYLRLLLTVERGAQSYEALYEYEGVQYPTYRAACIARGLAENDQEWIHCFDEAISFSTGTSLRILFLTAVKNRIITDPAAIWEKYKTSFCDDLLRRLERLPLATFPLPLSDPHLDYGLHLIETGLADGDQTLTEHHLPAPTFNWAVIHEILQGGRRIVNNQALADQMRASFNAEQLQSFNTIVSAITDSPQTAHFYLQGPGGTGKTFLYKALCYYYRAQGKTILCVASTGIAALLLPNGRTSHSQFKLPIDINALSTCGVTKQSRLGKLLARVDLIIWDEVPMQHKHCFMAVHRLLVDLRSVRGRNEPLFGGVPIILGGDFAQILPVVPNGSRTQVVDACLQQCFVWESLKRLRLRTNMRVRSGPEGYNNQPFIDWISSILYDPLLCGSVSIPDYIS
jgi:hypothetical protein